MPNTEQVIIRYVGTYYAAIIERTPKPVIRAAVEMPRTYLHNLKEGSSPSILSSSAFWAASNEELRWATRVAEDLNCSSWELIGEGGKKVKKA